MSKEINVVRFSCEGDLSKYIDSMLFDSGEQIAAIEYQIGEYSVKMDLVVSGWVRVIYRGDTYTYPSEFPAALKELFRSGLAYESTEVYIEEGNWFNFDYSIFRNGEEIAYDDVPYESEVHLLSTEGLKQEMAEFAHQLILEEISSDKKDLQAIHFPKNSAEGVLLNKDNLLEQISYIKAAHPSAETSDYFRGFHAGIDLIIGYIESQNK